MGALPSSLSRQTLLAARRPLALAVAAVVTASTMLVGAALIEAIVFVLVAEVCTRLLVRHPATAAGHDASPSSEPASPRALDVNSLEVALEAMSSSDPQEARSALAALSDNGHARLIPALVLRHPHPAVLRDALAFIAVPERTDWVPLAHRLLDHPALPVRDAALHALSRVGAVDSARLADGVWSVPLDLALVSRATSRARVVEALA